MQETDPAAATASEEVVDVGLAVVDGRPVPADPLPTAGGGFSAGTRARIAAAVPPNTRRAYDRQLAAFGAWCANVGYLRAVDRWTDNPLADVGL